MRISKTACLAALLALTVLAGCIEISQILSPPPPVEEEVDWTQFGIGNTADDADTNGEDDVDTNGESPDDDSDAGPDTSEDTDSNGTDDASTNGADDVDTNGADDVDTNGGDDVTTDGVDDADTNGANTNGIPPLPDDAVLTTTDSGLQYYDFEEGIGDEPPSETVTVRVAYTGYLPDGTIFDSNEDATFVLSNLIAGFTEGVLTMKEGGRRRLFIPPDIGYGAGGNPGAGIGGKDTIVFDVTLHEVVSQ